MIDVNVFVGAYPFRRVPGSSPESVLAAMARIGVRESWVTHLPALFWRDPSEGADWLEGLCQREPTLRPVPSVHPGLPRWEADLERAVRFRAPAVRADPGYFGLAPTGPEMKRLVGATAEHGVPLMMAVRLEDGRQRHPLDLAPELPAAAIRTLIRQAGGARLIITHAERSVIEEVHFGSTPSEAGRIWWDISWVWGPPEDHLQALIDSIGPERFLFGTGQPLRLPENAVAKLDLLDLGPDARSLILEANARILAPEPL